MASLAGCVKGLTPASGNVSAFGRGDHGPGYGHKLCLSCCCSVKFPVAIGNAEEWSSGLRTDGRASSVSRRWRAQVSGDRAAKSGIVTLARQRRTKEERIQLQPLRGSRLISRATYEDENGLPEDAISDGPIPDPPYYTYNDPNTGEPAPTYGARTPLPDRKFWNEDMVDITRSTQASTPFETSRLDLEPGDKIRRAGNRRRKNPLSTDEVVSTPEEEAANALLLQNLKEKWNAEDEKEDDAIGYFDSDDDEEEEEEEEEEEFDDTDQKLVQQPAALATIEKAEVDVTESTTPLTNEELWWNWRKPDADEKPWSAWQKRAGDCDTVMAAAMAESGQIELFGDKPTIAEATLARARKRVFYDERMEAEDLRKREIGAMAYYQEWVKAWDQDTSKEAVQKHFEETGEEEGLQLLDMFESQTLGEYRQMQGTDIRIRRDPLTMRMREEQIKQVWGGDPVYPTINYVQDPDEIADYRNANMHEPIPDIVEMLRESGRLISQEEVKRLQDLEKAQELEFAEEDILSGAVDIGDEEEDETDDKDEDEDEDEAEEEQPQTQMATMSLQKLVENSSFELIEEDGTKLEFSGDDDDETQ